MVSYVSSPKNRFYMFTIVSFYDLGVGLMFESSWCHLCDPFYDPLALLKATKDPLSRPFKTKREKSRDLYSELLIQRA